jgi:hypothetical protein
VGTEGAGGLPHPETTAKTAPINPKPVAILLILFT